MTDKVPDVHKLGVMLADLHTGSVSPNGKYGFPVTTYHGTVPQKVNWQDSWEGLFRDLIEHLLSIERQSQGPDEVLKDLTDALLTKVVPRLLCPLETGGRKTKPRLLHGDIWNGNTSTNADTDLPVIFNAAYFYGHNESKSVPDS